MLWGLVFGLGAGVSQAETGSSPPVFEIWPGVGGWEQNTLTAIIQSHDGYLWLGTYHGLVRFDGVRFATFDSGNSPGLQNGLVTSLYEDDSGLLWIGLETGELARFAGGVFKPVALGGSWPGGAIEAISSDEQGDVWVLNDTGFLLRVRDGLSALCPGGASPSRKAALTRAKDGRIWVVSNGKAAILEHGRVVPFDFAGADTTNYFDRVLPARAGGLWVLGNDRLRKWEDGRWTSEIPNWPHSQGGITTLLEARSGAIIAGTLKDGLYVMAPAKLPLHFARTNGLSHDWVRALCEDREGNIWIGTGAGFDGLRPRRVQMLDAPDGWQGCAVLSFSVGADGSAWIGSEGAGLYRYSGSEWAKYGEANGLSNSFVWSVLETKAGELYAGTWGGGLYVKKGERFVSAGELDQITAPVVSLYEGSRGEVWIGTKLGLHRLEGGRITWSAGKDRLALPDVRAITESPDGTLWFGMSGGGLGALKEGMLRQYRKTDGVGSDFVLCFNQEPDGTLWYGTADNGIGRWKNGKFARISGEQGLRNGAILHLVDDGAGNFWVGSQYGILRVSKTELEQCADGVTNWVHTLSYGKAEGLASLTCSGGFQPGACRTSDGRLWFPTVKGMAILDPSSVTTNSVPPPVVIEEMLVDRQSRPLASSASADAVLQIPPGRQQFEIHYTGLSFTAPEKVLFKYRLKGLESEWTEPGTKRVAPYSYLPPRSYTFQVIACNNDEVWNETGASLSFVVLPYFWQTWWFEVSSLGSGAGCLGAGVFWISRRRVRRRLELLEREQALERERTRIARDIHDDLGASLTRITMLCQSARAEMDSTHQAAGDVDRIYGTARELTRAMDEIVWAVNPKHDTLDSLVTYLGRYAQNFLSAAAIRCRLDVPLHLPPWALTSEVRHNLFLAFKECLNNVVKHAHASEVRISLELQAGGFVLLIVDNGRGFDWNQMRERVASPGEGLRLAGGNGLLNMRRRMEEAGGRCEWVTAPSEGTRVRLYIAVRT